ncbi:NAD+ synthase [Halothiobacillus diazotrophicus]|uniref:Glutamine-dependent NAD(+) synthetase n=1 Tax=Halothiobacillus diazotrophicus TaxID=1860122 RepID=A0A191ZH43_9GAMM|nr:NAD+ synthase [Halothiobacillus diazotrophicus]ANJ67206.1 NAD+ synthase [Halothiobacillus diazotrophicus]
MSGLPSDASALRIALAQITTRVGDCVANADRVIEMMARARRELGARVVVFPELTLTGYPPEDLLLREDFLAQCETQLARIAEAAGDMAVVIGAPLRVPDDAPPGLAITNAAVVIEQGRIVARYDKRALPNYGVFDEKRYFRKGRSACVVPIDGVPLGITICEDIWEQRAVREAAEAGARVILTLNASPYHRHKTIDRERVVAERIDDTGCPVVYVNLVGGQDELVFDGRSFVATADKTIVSKLPAFAEGLGWVDVAASGAIVAHGASHTWPEGEQEVYSALTTGIRDYVRQNGFHGVVLGLSGGIDSALVLTLAVDALGADNVLAVRMPSRYTSQMSLDDAAEQCQNLGVRCETLPIESVFESLQSSLSGLFAGLEEDATEENLQARTRGVLLMALSNKFGRMLLTTGNKSELAVGYATLYGDMAGGFAPIKDVPKTLVYALARWRNQSLVAGRLPIPLRVIEREPSAELRANQKDSDSLPPYDLLDRIIRAFVEEDQSVDDMVTAGMDQAIVRRVVRLILLNEYKRRQAPPGIRISRRAFGRDRRYPITSGFRPE